MTKFPEMPYVRPDKDELLGSIEAMTLRFKEAASADEALAVVKEMDKLCDSFYTVSSLCYVRNTIDTRDPFYKDERAWWDQIEPLISEKLQIFNQLVAATPFRAEMEKTLGALYFTNIELALKGFSPEIIPLMQEENELCSAYQELYASAQVEFDGKTLTIAKLGPYKQNPDRAVRKAALEAEGSFFDEHQAELDEIYDKLVKNRTAQAKALGFETYVDLGYIRMRRNCYAAADVAKFRDQVVDVLVPITEQIKKAQAGRIGVDHITMYDQTFCFPDGNAAPKGTPEELLEKARQMYTEMSPETAAFIDMMFEMELFDLVAKDGKAPGGYCTSFPDYKCPFVFSNFNGTSGDVDVLTHEAGHAFADYIAARTIEWSDLRSPTMEGCETHSMSMEFFTAPWHHLFFEEQTAKYELSHAEDTLVFIPYGCMVDHFQELVYLNPDWTPAQRNACWAELEKRYRPYLDMEGLPFYGRGAGWQRQLHIYQSPFYYIEYCMAQTIALQFWVASMKDQADAWKRYCDFVGLGGTKTFVDLVHAVGLKSPMDEGALASIAGDVVEWLNANQV